MTPDAFTRWLAAMKAAGLARTDADCARLLGLTPHAVVRMKREGVTGAASTRTALACRALLDGLAAYE